jgi:N-methylhydantoinase A
VLRLGVDVGGTFTDLVLLDGHGALEARKGLTVPAAPDEGVAELVQAAVEGREVDQAIFLHGTTVALNVLLERSGAKVGLLVTDGFRDVLELRRGERDRMYDLCWKPSAPLVARRLRLPVRERIRADGAVERPLEPDDVAEAAARFAGEGVTSVAIVFLNSYANPAHELEAVRVLREAGFDGTLSLSHQVSGEYREYERTSTTVVDAYVRPRVSAYLDRLRQRLVGVGLTRVFVTNSGGGAMSFDEASARPFETIGSGPAAGAVGAAELCRELGIEAAVTADVGGTSFDTCLIVEGSPRVAFEGRVADMIVQTPWVDVRSVGSGGGSIAYVDDGGLLRVGPESAGADPGPVCYGRGGKQPTVTDAAAALGLLGSGELAGGVVLDLVAARDSLKPLAERLSKDVEEIARGIIEIAAARMADAIREVTGEQGQDPREATLIAFGGAGPLFATMLARELGLRQVVVPPHAGNFSALRLLRQDVVRSAAETSVGDLDDERLDAVGAVLARLFDRLLQRSTALGETAREAALDMRYVGQDYTLTVPLALDERDRPATSAAAIAEAFAGKYARTFGHELDEEVEIVSVRATLRTPLAGRADGLSLSGAALGGGLTQGRRSLRAYSFSREQQLDFELVRRSDLKAGSVLHGPTIVLEPTTTIYLDAGFDLELHPTGALLLSEVDARRSETARPSRAAPPDDPILAEVVRQGLLSAAEQMKIALRRTAFSPIVYDMIDFCCALYDRDVRLLAQAQATPLFLGTMGHCIEACVGAVGGLEALEDGDVLFSTYAYDIGSHPQDAAIVVPAFFGGKLIGYAAIKAHHMDIGAKEPFCTDTTDNFQEGAIFPGVRIYEAGRRNEDIYRTVLANSRLPTALAGDLGAQIVAAKAGIAAVARMIERYGPDQFERAVERILDHGEATVRHFLERIPDGRYVGSGALDNDGIGGELVPFTVALEVAGSEVEIDFTEAPPAQAGPVNCPLPTTISAARLAVMAIAGGGESANEGRFRPIRVRTRSGSLFHPEPPAPIYLYAWPAGQAIDAIHAALAEALPDDVTAGSGGDYCGIVWWGVRPDGAFWASGTDHVTGQGATSQTDGGPPLMHISFSGMRNTPAETLELRYPLLVERCELAPDSGGAGRFRGGPGLDVCYRMLADGFFTSPIERTRTQPWGLQGGEPARANALSVALPDGTKHALAKTSGFRVPAGSTIGIAVGGGGGYGPASQRDPDAVHADLADGYISEEAARRDYPHAFASGTRAVAGGSRAV